MDETQWTGQSGEVLDSSTGGNHGTAVNGGSTTEALLCRGGWFRGEGYNADPNNAYYPARYYVRVPDSNNLSPQTAGANAAVTISGWFKTEITNGTILHKGEGGDTQEYRVFIEGSNLKLQVWNRFGSSRFLTLNYGISAGQWYFFAADIQRVGGGSNVRASLRLYSNSNDSLLASASGQGDVDQTNKNTSGDLFIGAVSYGGTPTNYFDGVIDELRVYSGLRTNAQIVEDKNASRTCAGALQCLADDFGGVLSPDNWVTARSSGNFTPSVVDSRLRLTQAVANQSTSATFQRLYPAADNLVVIEFDYYAWSSQGGTGADGIAVILSDATITPQPGAFGGSLGYAQKGAGTDCPNCPGFAGGWLGIALDEYGNFSSPTEGRNGGPGFRPQSVSVRGSAAGNYQYLTGTAANISPRIDVRSTNQAAPGHRYRITVDSRVAGQALVSVQRRTGSDFTDVIPEFNALAFPGQAPVPENFFLSFTGSTGGSNNNHELDNLSICALRSSPVGQQINHIELTHQAAGIACLASAVEVKACLTADCSSLFTQPVSVDLSNSAGNWQTDPITLTNGVGTAYLRHPASGEVSIGVTETVPARKAFSETVCKVGGTNSNCQINFANDGLLFAQDDGVTPLSHQTAGVGFSGVLRAIKTNPDDLTCQARVSGSKRVELGFSCENPGTCIAGQQFTVNGNAIAANGAGASANRSTFNLTFDANGSAPLPMNYTDVGQLSLHASLTLPEQQPDPAVTLNGSSNAFVVRPHTLAVVQAMRQNGSVNPGTINAGEGFVAAGEAFNVEIESRNAAGAATPNFGREITRQLVTAAFNVLEYPAGGSDGVLTAGATDTNQPAQNGRQTVTNVSWNEAGSIRLQAKLNNDSYLAVADVSAKPASGVIGRFYPHHFALTSSEVSNSCDNTFSYMSEPALTINYQLNAEGAAANTLFNYHSDDYTETAVVSLVAEQNAVRLPANRLHIAGDTWQRGVYTVNQSDARFNRAAVPDGPYESLTLGIKLLLEKDDRDFQQFTLAPDAVALDGALNMRFGRLVLQNTAGPEEEPLPLVFRTEYWDDSSDSFLPSLADSCTLISANASQLETVGGSPDLALDGMDSSLLNGSLPAGPIWLSPLIPPVPGVWRVEYQTELWLQYNWSGKTTGCSPTPDDPDTPNCYDENPQADIMFGRFRGNPRQIFWRERFQ